MENIPRQCTEICLETCPVVSRLGTHGLNLAQARHVITTVSQGLGDQCGEGKPVIVQKGREAEWSRCDMHPELVSRLSAIAAGVENGVLVYSDPIDHQNQELLSS